MCKVSKEPCVFSSSPWRMMIPQFYVLTIPSMSRGSVHPNLSQLVGTSCQIRKAFLSHKWKQVQQASVRGQVRQWWKLHTKLASTCFGKIGQHGLQLPISILYVHKESPRIHVSPIYHLPLPEVLQSLSNQPCPSSNCGNMCWPLSLPLLSNMSGGWVQLKQGFVAFTPFPSSPFQQWLV